jgi:hypothetical protein
LNLNYTFRIFSILLPFHSNFFYSGSNFNVVLSDDLIAIIKTREFGDKKKVWVRSFIRSNVQAPTVSLILSPLPERKRSGRGLNPAALLSISGHR